ncbi:MAG: hypothetical protein HS126_36980 [Anaerolineales bacterium]|nr:hypothetical protein [Anaerolineales bacterium]
MVLAWLVKQVAQELGLPEPRWWQPWVLLWHGQLKTDLDQLILGQPAPD